MSRLRSKSRTSDVQSVDMEGMRRALHNAPMPVPPSTTPAAALRGLNQEVSRATTGQQRTARKRPKPLVLQELDEFEKTVPSLKHGLQGAHRQLCVPCHAQPGSLVDGARARDHPELRTAYNQERSALIAVGPMVVAHAPHARAVHALTLAAVGVDAVRRKSTRC